MLKTVKREAMPASNYAAIRYRIIDLCFTSRTKKYWTLEELLEKLAENDISISKRTLERDINDLRYGDRSKFYAPIHYNRSRKVFYYQDPTYSALAVHLDRDDVLVLQQGKILLQQFLALREFMETLQRVITQLEGKK